MIGRRLLSYVMLVFTVRLLMVITYLISLSTIDDSHGSFDKKTTAFQVRVDVFPVNKQVSFAETAAVRNGTEAQLERPLPRRVTRVLIVGYMRGGSTLFGELFNHLLNGSLYWYEPVDSFYMARYGFKQFSLPLSLMSFANENKYLAAYVKGRHQINTEPQQRQQTEKSSEQSGVVARHLEYQELTELTDFLTNLFTCDYHQLPLETFFHPFLQRSSFLSTTSECLNDTEGDANDCKKYIGDWCGGNADDKRRDMAATERRQCSKIISHFRAKRPTTLTRKDIDELKDYVPGAFFDEQDAATTSNSQGNGSVRSSFLLTPKSSNLSSKTGAKLFFEHFRCLDKLKKTSYGKCIEPAMKKCRNEASLIAIKVLRIRMSDIEPLLRRIPDIHVIHYVRDPRAIALSRVAAELHLMQFERATSSKKDRGNSSQIITATYPPTAKRKAATITESKHLCNRMLLDLRARQRLDARYPGAVSVIRYEDLIMDPRREVSELFRRIGAAEPDEKMYRWLNGKLFGKKEGHLYEISRENATATAEKWRHRISNEQVVQMTRYCHRVLVELGYELR